MTGNKRLPSIVRDLLICPDDDVAHYELGKVMVELGRFPQAEKEFEAALKINPDFIDCQETVGRGSKESLTLTRLLPFSPFCEWFLLTLVNLVARGSSNAFGAKSG